MKTMLRRKLQKEGATPDQARSVASLFVRYHKDGIRLEHEGKTTTRNFRLQSPASLKLIESRAELVKHVRKDDMIAIVEKAADRVEKSVNNSWLVRAVWATALGGIVGKSIDLYKLFEVVKKQTYALPQERLSAFVSMGIIAGTFVVAAIATKVLHIIRDRKETVAFELRDVARKAKEDKEALNETIR
jgi:hypothetical protein